MAQARWKSVGLSGQFQVEGSTGWYVQQQDLCLLFLFLGGLVIHIFLLSDKMWVVFYNIHGRTKLFIFQITTTSTSGISSTDLSCEIIWHWYRGIILLTLLQSGYLILVPSTIHPSTFNNIYSHLFRFPKIKMLQRLKWKLDLNLWIMERI